MDQIKTQSFHHVTLTVTDVVRSCDFYALLGFQKIADLGARAILHNGTTLLAVSTAPDPNQARENDRFSENRVGLDHISFSVASHRDLEQAISLFDQKGIPHGEIIDLPAFGISVLAFRDPDNIQLELTAPHG